MKPAELITISINKEEKIVNVTVSEEDLSKAIGRKGQNARLSSRLMGWDVQVRRDETKEEQFRDKIGGVAHSLGEQLGITDELAEKLTLIGGVSADMIIDMPAEFLTGALEITEEEAESILSSANAIVAGSEVSADDASIAN